MKLKKLLLAMICTASISAAYADTFSITETNVSAIKKDQTGAYFVQNGGVYSISATLSAATLVKGGFDSDAFLADPTKQVLDVEINDLKFAAPLTFGDADKGKVTATQLAAIWTLDGNKVLCGAESQAVKTAIAEDPNISTEITELKKAAANCKKNTPRTGKIAITGDVKRGIAVKIDGINLAQDPKTGDVAIEPGMTPLAGLCTAPGVLTAPVTAKITLGDAVVDVDVTINCGFKTKAATLAGVATPLNTVKLTGKRAAVQP